MFFRWISLDSTNDLCSKLLKEVSLNELTSLSGPTPLFTSGKPIFSAGLKSPSTPPKANSDFGYHIFVEKKIKLLKTGLWAAKEKAMRILQFFTHNYPPGERNLKFFIYF